MKINKIILISIFGVNSIFAMEQNFGIDKKIEENKKTCISFSSNI